MLAGCDKPTDDVGSAKTTMIDIIHNELETLDEKYPGIKNIMETVSESSLENIISIKFDRKNVKTKLIFKGDGFHLDSPTELSANLRFYSDEREKVGGCRAKGTNQIFYGNRYKLGYSFVDFDGNWHKCAAGSERIVSRFAPQEDWIEHDLGAFQEIMELEDIEVTPNCRLHCFYGMGTSVSELKVKTSASPGSILGTVVRADRHIKINDIKISYDDLGRIVKIDVHLDAQVEIDVQFNYDKSSKKNSWSIFEDNVYATNVLNKARNPYAKHIINADEGQAHRADQAIAL